MPSKNPPINLTTEVVKNLALLEQGQAVFRDSKLQGFGIRVGATAKSFFVEKRVAGKNVRHTLGLFGQITCDQARKKAAIKLGEMTGGKDLNAVKKAEVQARKEDKLNQAAAIKHTVEGLCDWYVKHQQARKKSSARDAENLFKNHVKGTEFAALPARALTARQATAMIRSVVEKGHGRTAAKLRAYLRAAYALAQGAETNPEAPAALIHFNVETNPIASTGALSSANKARDTVLTDDELGECVRQLVNAGKGGYDDGLAAMELSLRLGGQRIAQVLRITAADVDLKANTVTLLDPKGRRQTARRHVLPLTPSAVELMKTILKNRRGIHLFGEKDTQTCSDTVGHKGSDLLRDVEKALAEADEAYKPHDIQVRDLRRTAETMLAAMGISKDTRAQLLSHGLGGVQGRHYDQHDYMDEKRAALEAWERRLKELEDRKPVPTNVHQLPREKAAA